MSEFNPGDRVIHDDYGTGTVREHPDATDSPDDPRNSGTYVYFDDPEQAGCTTIMRVRSWELRKRD